MDKLRAMATFVAIVDHGSLSAAAQRLDRSPSAVVRGLAELEKQLGVRLLNRSTRQLSLTDEGRDYLLHCRRILAEIDEVEQRLDSGKSVPNGKLNLTAPVVFGRLHLAPLLTAWLKENPGMSAELTLLDRLADVIEEGFDLALRIGHLSDSSLIAMPLGHIRYTVCASPAWLARYGEPRHPLALAELPAVAFAPQGRFWQFQEDQQRLSQRIRPVFSSNQIDPVLVAAKAGLGIARVLSYQAQAALQTGELVAVLEKFAPPPIPVHYVYPHSRLISPRVRRFLDWSAPRLRESLQRVGPARP